MRNAFACALIVAALAGCGDAAREPLPPPPNHERPLTLDTAWARALQVHDVRGAFAALGAPDEVVGSGITVLVWRYPPESLRIGARGAQPESPVVWVRRSDRAGE